MAQPNVTAVRYSPGTALEFLHQIWELYHALEKLSSQMHRHLGITAQQRLIIRLVGTYPGLNVGTLASLLAVDRGTVSATVKLMESKGLLERQPDPEDGRRVMLRLTAAGEHLDQPGRGTAEQAVQQLLHSATLDDIGVTRNVLARLTRLFGTELQDLRRGHLIVGPVPHSSGVSRDLRTRL